MEIKSPRYLNPYTDYGFKRLFGMEGNRDLLIDFLNYDFDTYQESLLGYWESKGMIDTARDEGRVEGIEIGEQKKAMETAKKLKARGFSKEVIIEITGLSVEKIEEA
jgi:hypothetical protein